MGGEKLIDYEFFWSDLVIEEIRWRTRDGTSSTNKEEDFSLLGKQKNAKGKKSQGEEGERDLSKINCFHYHEHGHYALNCPQKKASKKEPVVATGEALASQFKLDFTLVHACPALQWDACSI